MRQVARKGLITIAAAGGLLAAAGGYAHADAGAQGGAADSPGVGSGNSLQVPVHVPVNVCGNTVDVVGLLNPAFGNDCANGSGAKAGGHHADQQGNHDQGGKHRDTSGTHHGSGARGETANSPGVASGNNIQAPIDVPVNACGNTLSVVGLLNPAHGNDCGNDTQTLPPTSPEYPEHPEHPEHPDKPTPPKPEQPPGPHPQTGNEPHAQIVSTPRPAQQLAQTGAGPIGYAVPAAAGLLLGGAVVYRKARTARR